MQMLSNSGRIFGHFQMDKFRQDVNKKLKVNFSVVNFTSSSAGVSNVKKPVNNVEKGFTI